MPRSSKIHCPFSHLQGTVLGLVPPNKSRRVHEDTTLNTGDARKILVSDPAPRLGQRLATLEALGRDTNGLNPPITAGLVWIDDIVGLRIRRHRQLLLQLKQVLLFER